MMPSIAIWPAVRSARSLAMVLVGVRLLLLLLDKAPNDSISGSVAQVVGLKELLRLILLGLVVWALSSTRVTASRRITPGQELSLAAAVGGACAGWWLDVAFFRDPAFDHDQMPVLWLAAEWALTLLLLTALLATVWIICHRRVIARA